MLVVKGVPQPTQKTFTSKREHRHSPTGPYGSQERLDSGLGSYESHLPEALYYDTEHRNSKPPSGGRHRCVPANRQPCSGCSYESQNGGSMSLSSPPNPEHMSYGQPRYHSYGGGPVYPPVNMSQYSYHHSRGPPPHHGYWSDHFGAYPPASQDMRGQGRWSPSKPNPQLSEREQVRKKLLAIFNARLVDRAMDTFPHILDPQRLAAEILILQSHDGAL